MEEIIALFISFVLGVLAILGIRPKKEDEYSEIQYIPLPPEPPIEPLPAIEVAPMPQSPQKPVKREILYATAKACLGKDMAPTQDELGCAESLSFVLMKAGVKGLPTKGILGTPTLNVWLRKNLKEIALADARPGDVIMNVTGTGNGRVSNGHTGVLGYNCIMSNNSNTGKWECHWTLAKWIAYYETKGGMNTHIYRWV